VNTLAGTGSLVRLALRRDRVLVPAWIVTFVGMAAFSASATVSLYPTMASRVEAAQGVNGVPALVALYGRIYEASTGALSMMKMGGIGTALVAVLAFVLVVRHTRADEEVGRLELIGGSVVGRNAALTAAIVVGVGTSLAIGVLASLGLAGTGLPVRGSVAFGMAWAATGLAFTAVGALAAQVTTGGRTATGVAAAFLGLAYVLRAAGDNTGTANAAGWLSWLSPIGWSQQVRPYAHERWTVLLLLVVFAVAVGSAAYVIASRRDLGAGLLADRPGPSIAAPSLSSPLGLAWRLHRGAWFAWAPAYVLLGGIFGSVASNLGGLLDSPQAKDFITKLGGSQALSDAFLAMELGMVAVVTAVYGIQATLLLRSEEGSQRAEQLLATSTRRRSWVASHLGLALTGTTGLMLVAGLVSGATHAAQTGDVSNAFPVLAGALVQLPAIWVVIGIAVALWGIVPRFASASWALLVAFLLLGEFGTLFELPSWAMDLSPFAHTPRIPGHDLAVMPLVWLVAIAAALIAAGVFAFDRRDLG
jgi:ABC-2 type transport system permease protein